MIPHKITYFITVTLLGVILVVSIPNNAHAATATSSATVTPKPTPLVPDKAPEVGINLAVSPVFINLTTDPGETVASQIRVRNNNNIREYLQISLMKFESDATGEHPVITEVKRDDPFLTWISFSQNQFIVDPNESKTIRFTVTPDKSAALGYYYAVVVSRIEEKNASTKEAVIAGSPAISLLLEVRSPYAKRELQLLDFKTDHFIYEYLPVTFDIAVKNTGNIHAIPFGDIFIDQGTTQDIGIIRANQTRGNILPQTTRHYVGQWSDAFAVRVPKDKTNKQDKIIYETKWDLEKANKFRIGKYTAHLLMVYDNGQRDIPLEATVSFWVIPWKETGVALLVFGFAVLGLKNTFISIIRAIRNIFRRR